MDVIKEYCASDVVKKATMPTDVPQSEEVRMGMLKECVLYVVKKGTMPVDVQQSVRTRSRDLGLYCLKCGEDRHLASWCEKENDN